MDTTIRSWSVFEAMVTFDSSNGNVSNCELRNSSPRRRLIRTYLWAPNLNGAEILFTVRYRQQTAALLSSFGATHFVLTAEVMTETRLWSAPSAGRRWNSTRLSQFIFSDILDTFLFCYLFIYFLLLSVLQYCNTTSVCPPLESLNCSPKWKSSSSLVRLYYTSTN